MGKATGIIEVFGLTAAFVAVDAGCKAANVTVETLDKNKPGNADALPVPLIVCIKFRGSVEDVKAAVEAAEFAASARANGFGVLIAAAGMAAHLAGAIAARTTLPVIGIPCKSSNLDGLDALLSTVQMPTGIPVATVAINGGGNAALIAAQILALSDEELAKRLDDKREADAEAVLAKDAAIAREFNY